MLSLFVHLQTFFVTSRDRLANEDRGATAVEYGLLVGLIAVAIVATLLVLGPRLNDLFQTVYGAIPVSSAAA